MTRLPCAQTIRTQACHAHKPFTFGPFATTLCTLAVRPRGCSAPRSFGLRAVLNKIDMMSAFAVSVELFPTDNPLFIKLLSFIMKFEYR